MPTGIAPGQSVGGPSAILGVINLEGLHKDSEIIDRTRILRSALTALEGGDRQGGEQADDHDHDHDLHQRESAGGGMRRADGRRVLMGIAR